MTRNAKESLLAAAKRAAQAHGYSGLNFRELAAEVGIKAASVHFHFPSKADLGAAVAKRYWQDTSEVLAQMEAETPDPVQRLQRFPEVFRVSLENGNRLCLGSFMSAEYDDLPEAVKSEVQVFADVNVAWLRSALLEAGVSPPELAERRARAIFAAVAGAQLVARSRDDIALFDTLIATYRDTGLLSVR